MGLMEVEIFAWEGDMSQGFYVVPADKADDFESCFNTNGLPWVREPINQRQPRHYLSMQFD